MEELKIRANGLKSQVGQASERIKLSELQAKFDNTQAEMGEPGFWENRQRAAQVSKEASQLLARIEPWQTLAKQLDSLIELIESGDASMQSDLNFLLAAQEKKFESLKKELQFQRPYDDHDVILSIHAGAGGTDAQDWTQMLLRMYARWAEAQKLNVKTVEESAGEEAGLKSVTIEITDGSFLY